MVECLMEKLHLIFLNHSWEQSLLPWGHISGVRKKSCWVIAISRVPHAASSYGVHITETTWQMQPWISLCAFHTWLSGFLVAFTSVTSLLHIKSQGQKGGKPNLPGMLGRIFQIKTRICNFFFYIVPNGETFFLSSLPGLWGYVSLDCAFTHFPAQLGFDSFRHVNRLDELSLWTDCLMPKKGALYL